VHNPRESLFQGTGSLSLHDNIFVDTPRTAIAVQRHHGQSPRRVRIYHNTFFRTARPVRISGLPAGAERIVAGNLLLTDAAAAAWPDNAILAGRAMTAGIAAPVLTFGKMDLQPRKPVRGTGLDALRKNVADDADADRDYWRNAKPQFDHCGAIALPFSKPRPIDLGLRKDIGPDKRLR